MENYLKFFNSRSTNRPALPLPLYMQCIHEVHKNSLKTLCSGSSESVIELRSTLQGLPEIILEQIFADLFELSETFYLVDIKPNLPNEWTQKYFCLLIHVITNEYSRYCESWRDHLDLIPDTVKTDLLESLEKYFFKNGNPDYYEEMGSWMKKYLHLIEYEVYWAHHQELGLSMYDICGTPSLPSTPSTPSTPSSPNAP